MLVFVSVAWTQRLRAHYIDASWPNGVFGWELACRPSVLERSGGCSVWGGAGWPTTYSVHSDAAFVVAIECYGRVKSWVVGELALIDGRATG